MERTCTSDQGRCTPLGMAGQQGRKEHARSAKTPQRRGRQAFVGVQRGRWLRGLAAPGLGGLLVFSASLLGLPLSTTHLAQFEALNRELGKLCSKPPPQAFTVCRLHARLVNGL